MLAFAVVSAYLIYALVELKGLLDSVFRNARHYISCLPPGLLRSSEGSYPVQTSEAFRRARKLGGQQGQVDRHHD